MFGLFRRSGTPENSPRTANSGDVSKQQQSSSAADPTNAIRVKLVGDLNVGSVLSAKCKMPNGAKKAKFKWHRLGRLGAGHSEEAKGNAYTIKAEDVGETGPVSSAITARRVGVTTGISTIDQGIDFDDMSAIPAAEARELEKTQSADPSDRWDVPTVRELAVMLTEEKAIRTGWVERPLKREDFAKLRIKGRAEVGRVLEIVGLPRGVPSNALLITWQRVHWRPDKQRLSIQRIAGPGKLQLSVPRECAGWVVRALVAPLLSDGTIGYIGAAEAGPVPGKGSDEHGEWVVAEGAEEIRRKLSRPRLSPQGTGEFIDIESDDESESTGQMPQRRY